GIDHIIGLQTNGTLLDDGWLDYFATSNIAFSISLDGPPLVHDACRLDHGGQPTSHRVVNAINLVNAHPARKLFGGVLCVANPLVSGREVIEYLFDLGITKLNFLLPDGNHANPPKPPSSASDLGRFLCEAFDAWYDRNDPELHVTLFKETIL